MTTEFRIDRPLLERIHADLDRRHPFVAERVGFIACRTASVNDGLAILAQTYLPVADEDYEENSDPMIGAMMGSNAIRNALQYAHNYDVAMFHVHRHEHSGMPKFSRFDLSESTKFVPDFWNVQPAFPHGTLVLSHDSAHGFCWDAASRTPSSFDRLVVVGRPLSIIRGQSR